MKKSVALILCVVMLLSAAACGDKLEAKKRFEEMSKNISEIKNLTLDSEYKFTVDTAALNTLLGEAEDTTAGAEEIITVSLGLDGEVSSDNKEGHVKMTLGFELGEGMSFSDKLTEVIYTENALYMDFRSILEFVTISDPTFDYDSQFEHDYVCFDVEALSAATGENIDAEEVPPEIEAMFKELGDKMKAKIGPELYTLSGNNTCTLTVSKSVVFSMLQDLGKHLAENYTKYGETIANVLWTGMRTQYESMGAAEEEIAQAELDFTETAKEIPVYVGMAGDYLTGLTLEQMPEISFKMTLKENTETDYEVTFSAAATEALTLEGSYSIKETEFSGVAVPEESVPYEDIAALMEGFSGFGVGSANTIYITIDDGESSQSYVIETYEAYLLDAIYAESDNFVTGYYDANNNVIIDSVAGIYADVSAGETWKLSVMGEDLTGNLEYVPVANEVEYVFTLVK